MKCTKPNPPPLEIINEIVHEGTKESIAEEHTVRPSNLSSKPNLINFQEKIITDDNKLITIETKRKSYNVKMIKKANSIKDSLQIWRDIDISTIIPQKRLNSFGNNDIIYSGEMYKYINDNKIDKSS